MKHKREISEKLKKDRKQYESLLSEMTRLEDEGVRAMGYSGKETNVEAIDWIMDYYQGHINLKDLFKFLPPKQF
jgi:hypothetical protein